MLCAEALGTGEKRIVYRVANYVRSMHPELRKESLKVHAKHLAVALDRPEETMSDALMFQMAEIEKILAQDAPGEGPGPVAG